MLTTFIFLFWTITFGASFFEKIFDFNNTLSWLEEYLKNTPLRSVLRWVLILVIIAELLASIFCLLGLVLYWYKAHKEVGIIGIEIGLITLFCFLIGQRLAKDYEGARGMVLYILTAFVSLYMLQ